MRITIVRRITQAFFFALFLWFCVCATIGRSFWQLGGWPVNWFLQLDPLVALGSMLTTRTLYAGLAWAVATVALTAVLGRFFCGWVCPFGALHHFVGWLGSLSRSIRERVDVNRYRGSQRIKYYVLLFLLAPALAGLAQKTADSSTIGAIATVGILGGLAIALAAAQIADAKIRGPVTVFAGLGIVWVFAGWFFKLDGVASSSLITGLLDPIPLVYRSVNFLLLPLADSSVHLVTSAQRHYEGAWLTGAVFFGALFLNLAIPRFYCRFVCPLGALFGLLGGYGAWRIGKKSKKCSQCGLCANRCEGACDPSGNIRISECVLCMNCLDTCHENLMGYHTFRSLSGETVFPDLVQAGIRHDRDLRNRRRAHTKT